MNSNKITDLGTPTADTDAATKAYVDTQTQSQALTFVGDDSTGTAVNSGETFRIAGTQNITTAVSGDTLTITGPDLSNYLQNTGTQTIDNLSFNDNIISTSSNADLILDPGGTGDVRINTDKISLGNLAGQTTQGANAVAVGGAAGYTGQGGYAVAVGPYAGQTTQGANAIAVGYSAGNTTQGGSAVAVGRQAGNSNQGDNAIAIGHLAGYTNQAARSIVINATGTTLNNIVEDTFVVKPVRNATGSAILQYDSTTGEITHSTLTALTVVGDDSTGTTFNTGETFRIAGTQNITTAVSGDTLTITGPDLSVYATQSYVDSASQGLDVKNSVKLATTLELTNEDTSPPTYDNGTAGLGATLTFVSTITTIDGVSGLQNGDRILIKNQSDQATNGIYVRTSGTVYTRAVDADTAGDITGGTFVFVEQGTVNGDSGFVFTHNGTPTVGTTALTVSQFSGAGQITAGAGLEKSGNTLSVADGGITNSKLQNSGIIVVDDTSTASTISLGETLKIAGGTGITTAVSADTITITGTDPSSYLQNTGTQTIDNLTFNDNIIGTASNADLILQPGGTGKVRIATDTISLGNQAGVTSQGDFAVAIGYFAGETSQDASAVAIGEAAGRTNQSTQATAVGPYAGYTTQGAGAVAVGGAAGYTGQGRDTVAIGNQAGTTAQGEYGIAIGDQTGKTDQGASAIAIGQKAGETSQAANSIVINATGAALNNIVEDVFIVKPVRGVAGATLPAGFKQVAYNPTTGEFIYYDA